ncbi:MAG: hypothetical protein AB1497_10145 [Bacillota bacterium]
MLLEPFAIASWLIVEVQGIVSFFKREMILCITSKRYPVQERGQNMERILLTGCVSLEDSATVRYDN